MKKSITTLILTIFLNCFSLNLYSQKPNEIVQDYNFEIFKKKFVSRNSSKTPAKLIIDQEYSQLTFETISFDNETKKQLSLLISETIDKWNYLRVVTKINKKNQIWIGKEKKIKVTTSKDKFGLGIKHVENGKDASITINDFSFIKTQENDTLLLVPIKESVYNSYTVEYETHTYLYFLYLKEIIGFSSKEKAIKNDIISLDKHFSNHENPLKLLSNVDLEKMNFNFQNKLIQNLDSLIINLNESYLVVVNILDNRNNLKPYLYTIAKNNSKGQTKYYSEDSYGTKTDLGNSLPITKKFDNVLFVDTSKIEFSNPSLIKKVIEENNYISRKSFPDRLEVKDVSILKVPRDQNNQQLLYTSVDTLFCTRGRSPNNPFEDVKNGDIPTFKNFVEKYISYQEKDFGDPKSYKENFFEVHENYEYSKNKISFSLSHRNSFGGTIEKPIKVSEGYDDYYCSCGFDRKKLYEFYTLMKPKFDKRRHEEDSVLLANEKRVEEEKLAQKQKLYQTYGKKYVDAAYDFEFIVGMHEDLANIIVQQLWFVDSTDEISDGSKRYWLKPNSSVGTKRVIITIKDKKITRVSSW